MATPAPLLLVLDLADTFALNGTDYRTHADPTWTDYPAKVA